MLQQLDPELYLKGCEWSILFILTLKVSVCIVHQFVSLPIEIRIFLIHLKTSVLDDQSQSAQLDSPTNSNEGHYSQL
jgi:hypothetical protein